MRPTPDFAAGLALDTHAGRAYVSAVPFRMEHVGPRGLANLPWISAFAELNLRTYVSAGGKPGVWFFSLDAANPLAVVAARTWFHLPYFNARMRVLPEGDGIAYDSRRVHRGAPSGRFTARYGPTGDPFEARPSTLDHWLTERYCLYAHDGRYLLRSEVHHAPWLLQPATLACEANTLAAGFGISVEGDPLLHFARRQDVVAWLPERCSG